MVAGDSPRMCRRATAREPTGSPVSTYSAMTARSTCRLRLSRTGPLMDAPILLLEQVGEQRIREQEARLGEPHAPVVLDEKPPLSPGVERLGQAAALERAALGEVVGRHAVARAQSEHEPLGQGLARSQHLVAVERQPPGLREPRVALHRLDVGVAHGAEEAARARARTEILLPAPVALVVARAMARTRVARDLVVLVARLRGRAGERPVLGGDGLLGRHPADPTGVPE